MPKPNRAEVTWRSIRKPNILPGVAMKKGFHDEKHMWKWMKPKMRGRWDRFEVMTMNGFPDVFGSPASGLHANRSVYIELKISDHATLDVLEASQIDYLPFLAELIGSSVYVCFGNPKRKELLWAWVSVDTRGLPVLNHCPAPDFFQSDVTS